VNPAVEYLAWVAGIWLTLAAALAWSWHRAAKRRARVVRDVAAYRAWRTAQLEQPLAERYPDLDHQLDQYAHRIRSLYTTEGDRP
jgi:Flp pilus assembly protein TadB